MTIVAAGMFFFLAAPAMAEITINFDNKTNSKTSGEIMKQVNVAGNTAGLAAEDPRLFVAKSIKILLGITGTLFFALIVFAGYVRLTAHGEEDRVKKSNSTAVAALLGLAIVLLAYAVTAFVTSRLYNATTYEPPYGENNETPNTTYEKTINIELF